MNHEAVYALYPNVVRVLDDVAYDVNGVVVKCDADAVAAWVSPEQYKRDRARAYPSIQDQLDQIYHEGIDAWKATIAAVKQEYPKP